MSFELIPVRPGRPAQPDRIALSIYKTRKTLQGEIRLGRNVLRYLGVQPEQHVKVAVGHGDDAGSIRLERGGDGDRRVNKHRHADTYYVRFPGRAIADEPWPAKELEIIDAGPGWIVIGDPDPLEATR